MRSLSPSPLKRHARLLPADTEPPEPLEPLEDDDRGDRPTVQLRRRRSEEQAELAGPPVRRVYENGGYAILRGRKGRIVLRGSNEQGSSEVRLVKNAATRGTGVQPAVTLVASLQTQTQAQDFEEALGGCAEDWSTPEPERNRQAVQLRRNRASCGLLAADELGPRGSSPEWEEAASPRGSGGSDSCGQDEQVEDEEEVLARKPSCDDEEAGHDTQDAASSDDDSSQQSEAVDEAEAEGVAASGGGDSEGEPSSEEEAEEEKEGAAQQPEIVVERWSHPGCSLRAAARAGGIRFGKSVRDTTASQHLLVTRAASRLDCRTNLEDSASHAVELLHSTPEPKQIRAGGVHSASA
eukprot:TRINITY_DN38049_c0_g1_i4.p1 TRINITY_DN38049_c0_g1~~TRINITY_DN38049_c0_g1_i4.p1  ORF type:complete len:352 (-),score=76.81 TRINITY_DN38049_c0_g1_i4:376-1431(-)